MAAMTAGLTWFSLAISSSVCSWRICSAEIRRQSSGSCSATGFGAACSMMSVSKVIRDRSGGRGSGQSGGRAYLRTDAYGAGSGAGDDQGLLACGEDQMFVEQYRAIGIEGADRRVDRVLGQERSRVPVEHVQSMPKPSRSCGRGWIGLIQRGLLRRFVKRLRHVSARSDHDVMRCQELAEKSFRARRRDRIAPEDAAVFIERHGGGAGG